MIEKVKIFIGKHHLLDEQNTVIVATSSGCDSMVLGNVLHKLGYRMIAAHCNFHLRSKDSDADAAFVKKESRKYAEECLVKDFDTKKYMAENKIAVQEAARNLRYEWFAALSKKYDAPVAVAHHLDDQIETVYFNLIRGTGIKGICGMKPKNDYIIRPLLEVSKAEIKTYATENNMAWREDKSNESDKYTRNFIRHHLAPQLFELNKDFYGTFKRENLIFNEAAQLHLATLDSFLKENLKKSGNKQSLSLVGFKNFVAPHALLHHWLEDYGFNFQTIAAVVESLKNNKIGLQFEGTNGFILLKEREYLVLWQKETVNLIFEIGANASKITVPIKLEIAQLKKSKSFKIEASSNIAFLDFDKLIFPLVLRKWQEGDYFFPLGMKRKKKLSDFFIDEKINISEKKDLWLLCSGSDIVWIVGYRIDERYKITEGTKTILRCV